MDRTGIADTSPAGEKRGRGAGPGPAQDGETSTVDQSREWPYRDTAPRQDPAESRLDPIWGADPPDAVRWNMDMVTDEETASSGSQAAQSQAQQGDPAQPARRAGRRTSGERAKESGGSPIASPPPDGGPASSPGAQSTPSSGNLPTGQPPLTGMSRGPQRVDSDVGWFSTESDIGQYTGTLSERLSAERPGGEQPQPGMRSPWPAPVDPGETPGMAPAAGAERSTEIGGASNAGPPAAPDASTGTSSASSASGASSRGEAPSGDATTAGRQEPRSPELIESGMVYVDPDPGIGSPPRAAGWTEAAQAGPLGTREPSVPSPAVADQDDDTPITDTDPSPGSSRGVPPQLVQTASAESQSPLDSQARATGLDRPARSDPGSAASPSQQGGGQHGVEDAAELVTGTEVAGATPQSVQADGEEDRNAPRTIPDESRTAADLAGSTDAGAAVIDGTGAVPGSTGGRGTVPSSPMGDPPGVATTEGSSAVVGIGSTVGNADQVAAAPQAKDAGAGGIPGPGSVPEVGGGAAADSTGELEQGAGGARAVGVEGGDAGDGSVVGREAEAAFDSSSEDAGWDEPVLPMSWPPGMASPDPGGQHGLFSEDSADEVVVPQPDPTWPRLFGHAQEPRAGDDHGAGGRRRPDRESLPEADREAVGEASHERSPARQPRGGADSGSETNPDGIDSPIASPEPEAPGSPSAGAGAARPAPAGADPGARSTPEGAVPPWEGATEQQEELPAGPGGETKSVMTPGDAKPQPTQHARLVEAPPNAPGPRGRVGNRGRGDNAATTDTLGPAGTSTTPAVRAGAETTGHANTSTVIRTGQAGEVDLREGPPSPRSVDVSRETSADGGEEMDPGRENEAVEDEAAIAVRDAVTRAAAEAGVDVSRETEPLAVGVETEGSLEDATVNSELAARNARVTFRIQHDSSNGIRRVLAVANQKGGVGKSTTAVNIGAYLALAGARVLVIDLDPQGNASTGLGLDHREIEPSIYDVLMGEADPAAAIRATGVANLHVLPSTIDLAGAEVELVSAMSRETRLRRALQAIDHQYDTILIDCPPSLGLLTVNALAAADELLIPIQCEYYALEGLGQLLRNVELVRANLNPELRIGGIVLTMYDGRTRLALQVVDEVRKHFTDIVYQTVVPRSIRLSEAPGYGLPIALYDPLSRGGIAYRDLTLELAERSGLLAPTGEGAS
jgi:chromosome partitioning protein